MFVGVNVVEHNIIKEKNIWNVEGIYFDEKENAKNISGNLKVNVDENNVMFSYKLNLSGEDSKEIEFQFLLEKELNNNIGFSLKYIHPEIKEMNGRLMITDENLVLIYESENKEIAGSEYLKKISNDYYRNRGIIYNGNRKHSSWSLELRRVK